MQRNIFWSSGGNSILKLTVNSPKLNFKTELPDNVWERNKVRNPKISSINCDFSAISTFGSALLSDFSLNAINLRNVCVCVLG
jgi:hypothetical protein